VRRAQEYNAAGHRRAVDIDLEKFFDRVNHDVLAGLVAKLRGVRVWRWRDSAKPSHAGRYHRRPDSALALFFGACLE
jgi:hypothetical protein